MAAPRKPAGNVRNNAVLLLPVIIPERTEQEPQLSQSQETFAHHVRREELRISCLYIKKKKSWARGGRGRELRKLPFYPADNIRMRSSV